MKNRRALTEVTVRTQVSTNTGLSRADTGKRSPSFINTFTFTKSTHTGVGGTGGHWGENILDITHASFIVKDAIPYRILLRNKSLNTTGREIDENMGRCRLF